MGLARNSEFQSGVDFHGVTTAEFSANGAAETVDVAHPPSKKRAHSPSNHRQSDASRNWRSPCAGSWRRLIATCLQKTNDLVKNCAPQNVAFEEVTSPTKSRPYSAGAIGCAVIQAR